MAIEAKVKCDTADCESVVQLSAAHDFYEAEIQFYDLEDKGWSIDQDGVDLCPECNPDFDSNRARYDQALKLCDELIGKELNGTEQQLFNEAFNFCEAYEKEQGWQ
ncbi:hypothetical protein [Vibrio hepatarius]|uniref:hypothetical protein n=1 Tax=Vibrio hepatarius TaxID=171383 RepID=UPI00148CBE0C|nr:hypothetical protein [Vibrio hepatarius]NOI14798.1 hypothetical protein [Vibrio hepatarius]